MSSLVKRGRFYYYHNGNTHDPNSIRMSLGVSKLELAKRLQRELDERIAKERLNIGVDSLKIKLSNAISDFHIYLNDKKVDSESDSKKNRPNSWMKKQKAQSKRFLEFMSGDPVVDQIRTTDIMDFKSYLLDQYANKTARDYLLTIKEFFDFSKAKAYISVTPYDNTPKNFLPSAKSKKPRRPIPLRVIKKVIENAKLEEDRIYWTILLYTILRKNDAGRLSLNDIIQGKIQEKNKIPVPLMLPKEFRDNPEKAVQCMPTELSQRNSLARYQALMKEYGYETDFHAIRHSIATHLAQCGYKKDDIRMITGHDSKAVETYIHTGRSELELLLSKL